MDATGVVPLVFIGNRQRVAALDLKRLQAQAQEAVPLCLAQPGRKERVLAGLAEVEIALVSDRVIDRVHRQFMNIPGATDVITFAHGEIVVSVTTAKREATERGEECGREVLRYIVHGLLHLSGHEDAEATEAAVMWAAQEGVLTRLWPGSDGGSGRC